MKELIEKIAQALVDNPDEVHVNAIEGRTANAIRVILGAAGMTIGKRINLEILEK